MQKYGICLLGAAAMRQQPSHRSEMVSQLIFGETFTLLEGTKDWLYAESTHDQYQGWIAANQVQPISESTFFMLHEKPGQITADRFNDITLVQANETFLIGGGSSLPGARKGMFAIDGLSYMYKGAVVESGLSTYDKIPELAINFINTPYLWGGRSAFGMDCSGLVQIVYKMAGIALPRDSTAQSGQGESIHLIHESRPGDLAFFDNKEGVIDHVGILAGQGQIIHAHGKVRMDKIDHQGIFNLDTKSYSHKLRLIKRIQD